MNHQAGLRLTTVGSKESSARPGKPQFLRANRSEGSCRPRERSTLHLTDVRWGAPNQGKKARHPAARLNR
jgi:hypothetical protein